MGEEYPIGPSSIYCGNCGERTEYGFPCGYCQSTAGPRAEILVPTVAHTPRTQAELEIEVAVLRERVMRLEEQVARLTVHSGPIRM